MTVTRVSRTERSSDFAVWTLEFEFKEYSHNGRVSDWFAQNLFSRRHLVISSDLLFKSSTDLSAVKLQSFSARHKLQREGFPE